MKRKNKRPRLCSQVSGELLIGMRHGLRLRLAVSTILISSLLLGCAHRPVILHVIEKEDIVFLKKNETLTAPKDGAFLSSEYISEVMEAKVKRG